MHFEESHSMAADSLTPGQTPGKAPGHTDAHPDAQRLEAVDQGGNEFTGPGDILAGVDGDGFEGGGGSGGGAGGAATTASRGVG